MAEDTAKTDDPDMSKENQTPVEEKNEEISHEDQYRYKDLSDEDFSMVDSIVKGQLPLDQLPHLKSRVVRVFISSTFTDMANERNTIISQAYPKLRAYCRERYDMEFHPVDMRWGVPTGAKDDHSTTDLCMEEIVNCQRHSVGPNFVAFIGQRYGSVDLPRVLPHDQFEPIRDMIIAEMTEDKDIDLLDKWFKKDRNSVPPAYALQPISSVLGSDTKDWDNNELKLRKMLSFGAKKAVEAGQIPEVVMANINASVTEQELQCGIFDVQSSNQKKSNMILCFIREIDDIEDQFDKSKIEKVEKQLRRFLDLMSESNEADQVKRDAMTKLKNKLNVFVRASNVKDYSVKWCDPHGISPDLHEGYLNQLNTDFYNKMLDMIDENVSNQANQIKDELYDEILRQWDVAKMRCKNFLGRKDILKHISTYLLEETDKPLVIHGQSGYGKTSIIAKAASEITSDPQQQIDSTVPPYVLLRFCGTSVESSKIRLLLSSLSHQMAYITGKYRHQIPKDFKLLKAYFKDILQKGHPDQLIVIFIDAINQLSFEDNAHKLDWLPETIGNNVKIIISLISGDNSIYQKLRNKITSERYYIEVKEMSPALCGDIIHSCLQKRGRIINFDQSKLVRDVFNKCALPLFAKLTFEMVLDWKSFMDIPYNALATSVSAAIKKLFERLEEKHGKIIVSHALAYITASQGGISEGEMEDVLSLDDKVLNSVFAFWEPPLRRIPPILFPRIKHDITEYLVEIDCDKTTVMYWYHQQFIEAATERYLSQSELTDDIHQNLADYFMGTWSKMRKKPFLYAPNLAKRLRLKDFHSSAVRYVPHQPLIFRTVYNTEERFNFRKLNQMPYHLANARKMRDLHTQVYFNFDFLHTKLRACSGSIQRLISDFSLVEDHEVSIVADALRMSEAALAVDPDLLGVEISGRLLPHYHPYKNIQSLINQCDINSLDKCPVVPNWQVFTTPCGPLQYVCEADASINSNIDVGLIQSDDDTVLLTAKPFNGTKMRVWDITQGEPRQDIDLPARSRAYSTPDGVCINLFKGNKCLQTFRTDSGELYGEVNFPNQGAIHQVKTGNKYVTFTFERGTGPVIIDIKEHTLIHHFKYQAKAVAISDDQKYLVTNNGKTLAVHSLPKMELNCVTEVSHAPDKILFSSDSTKFYIQDIGHELKCIRMNLSQKKAKTSGILRDIEMRNFKLSHSGESILVMALRCLYIFDAQKEKINHRIINMPTGVFIERSSTFKEAGFTPNDELIVAARHIYLGIWSAKTGKPLYMLQPSVSPVVSLYTSDTVNKAIALLQDHTIQVWNLDNLDSDVELLNRTIIQGSIKCISSSINGDRLICCGKDGAEGKIINLNTNQCEWTLEHATTIGQHLDEVIMSPCGKFAVTRMENKHHHDFLAPWKLLKEDKLWDLTTGASIQMVKNSRHVIFSPNDDKVVFFVCKNYSTYDWSIISYDVIGMDLCGENAFKTVLMNIPDGDVIGNPVITSSGKFLAFLLQSKQNSTSNQNSASVSSSYINQLMIYSFKKLWDGFKNISLTAVDMDCQESDIMIDLQSYGEDSLFITYGQNLNHLNHSTDGLYDRSIVSKKWSIIYSVRKDQILKQLKEFLHNDTDVDKMILSNQNTFVCDQTGKLFSIGDNKLVNNVDISKALTGGICLILDGKYVAMISSSRRELFIYCISEGKQILKARLFLHGVADHITTGHNDRTVIVTCKDGRVMCLSVILGLTDHMTEYIDILPSRKTAPAELTPQENLNQQVEKPGGNFTITGTALTLKSDIKANTSSSPVQKKRFATITRERIMIQKKKSTMKSVGKAVMISNEINKVRSSKACVLQ